MFRNHHIFGVLSLCTLFLCLTFFAAFFPADAHAQHLFNLKEKEISIEMHEHFDLYIVKCSIPGHVGEASVDSLLAGRAAATTMKGRSSLALSFDIDSNTKVRNFLFKDHRELQGMSLGRIASASSKDVAKGLTFSLHFNRLAEFQISSVASRAKAGEVLFYIRAAVPAQQALVWKNVNPLVSKEASGGKDVSFANSDKVQAELKEAVQTPASSETALSELDVVESPAELPSNPGSASYKEELTVNDAKAYRRAKSDGELLKIEYLFGSLFLVVCLFGLLSWKKGEEKKRTKSRTRNRNVELPKSSMLTFNSHQAALVTLGLAESPLEEVELQAVKERYKHLAKVFHADKLAAKELPPEMQELAKQEFRRIKEAYTLLSEKLTGS